MKVAAQFPDSAGQALRPPFTSDDFLSAFSLGRCLARVHPKSSSPCIPCVTSVWSSSFAFFCGVFIITLRYGSDKYSSHPMFYRMVCCGGKRETSLRATQRIPDSSRSNQINTRLDHHPGAHHPGRFHHLCMLPMISLCASRSLWPSLRLPSERRSPTTSLALPK